MVDYKKSLTPKVLKRFCEVVKTFDEAVIVLKETEWSLIKTDKQWYDKYLRESILCGICAEWLTVLNDREDAPMIYSKDVNFPFVKLLRDVKRSFHLKK